MKHCDPAVPIGACLGNAAPIDNLRGRLDERCTSMIYVEQYLRVRYGRIETVEGHWRRLPITR